jgi:hypothetical protein
MRLTICLALACLLLAGCDPVFYTVLDPASTPDTPVFDLGTNPDGSGRADVVSYRVSRTPWPAATAGEWHTCWEIKQNQRGKIRLDKLRYGELPDGFGATTAPESLPAGCLYLGEGGFPGIGHDCWFEIVSDSTGTRRIRELDRATYDTLVKHRPG